MKIIKKVHVLTLLALGSCVFESYGMRGGFHVDSSGDEIDNSTGGNKRDGDGDLGTGQRVDQFRQTTGSTQHQAGNQGGDGGQDGLKGSGGSTDQPVVVSGGDGAVNGGDLTTEQRRQASQAENFKPTALNRASDLSQTKGLTSAQAQGRAPFIEAREAELQNLLNKSFDKGDDDIERQKKRIQKLLEEYREAKSSDLSQIVEALDSAFAVLKTKITTFAAARVKVRELKAQLNKVISEIPSGILDDPQIKSEINDLETSIDNVGTGYTTFEQFFNDGIKKIKTLSLNYLAKQFAFPDTSVITVTPSEAFAKNNKSALKLFQGRGSWFRSRTSKNSITQKGLRILFDIVTSRQTENLSNQDLQTVALEALKYAEVIKKTRAQDKQDLSFLLDAMKVYLEKTGQEDQQRAEAEKALQQKNLRLDQQAADDKLSLEDWMKNPDNQDKVDAGVALVKTSNPNFVTFFEGSEAARDRIVTLENLVAFVIKAGGFQKGMTPQEVAQQQVKMQQLRQQNCGSSGVGELGAVIKIFAKQAGVTLPAPVKIAPVKSGSGKENVQNQRELLGLNLQNAGKKSVVLTAADKLYAEVESKMMEESATAWIKNPDNAQLVRNALAKFTAEDQAGYRVSLTIFFGSAASLDGIVEQIMRVQQAGQNRNLTSNAIRSMALRSLMKSLDVGARNVGFKIVITPIVDTVLAEPIRLLTQQQIAVEADETGSGEFYPQVTLGGQQ